MLVIPVFNEAASLLDTLAAVNADTGDVLIILVLNRPANCADTHINAPMRDALGHLAAYQQLTPTCHLATLAPDISVLSVDLEMERGATASDKGVGLARKTGCDIALHWITQDVIDTSWICSSDADALLPADYFSRLPAPDEHCAGFLFPFIHGASGDPVNDEACLRYELRLHHYVLGLEYAGSPYAFHTLGSCLAVRATNYAQVRGFPPRAAAEDFYLLNKLAKTGPVIQASGDCISLSSRPSARVPFGTGPAIKKLVASTSIAQAKLYYAPEIFDSLKAVLASVEDFFDNTGDVTALLQAKGLTATQAEQAATQLAVLGIAKALEHCRLQAGDLPTFSRHFHQWFDGFRTLKFIHGLRDKGWPDLSLAELAANHPDFWPGRVKPEALTQCRSAILSNWHWLTVE